MFRPKKEHFCVRTFLVGMYIQYIYAKGILHKLLLKNFIVFTKNWRFVWKKL